MVRTSNANADLVQRLCEHVHDTSHEQLTDSCVRAAKTFILDSIGVGISGSRGPWAQELIEVQQIAAGANHARVWGRHAALPAPLAAMCNAYQIHNSEFDCVHEGAVVHPMAVLLGATLSYIDREGSCWQRKITGRDLLISVVVGVDIACTLGLASRAPLRFFRPATAGAFGATASIARLGGLQGKAIINAMGITLAQLCGTMQAHTEGVSLLAMQVGFNARNAIIACDMARTGIPGTTSVFEGPYGYLPLFEGDYTLDGLVEDLGQTWRITEVAHKPFPSGRATHGIIEASLELHHQHGVVADDIDTIQVRVPPLTQRLIGRAVSHEMTVNYARLCGQYVAARALLHGQVGLDDFSDEALNDPDTLDAASRVEIVADGNPDPNAMTPIVLEARLRDGNIVECRIDTIYGNPKKPLSREAHLEKFLNNYASSATPLPATGGEQLIELIDDLENIDDVRTLIDLMVPVS